MPTVKATKGPGTKSYNRYAYYLAMANGVDTRVPNRTRNRLAAERRKKEEERYLECARLCAEGMPVKKVAETLELSLSTAYRYRKNAEKILDSRRRAREAQQAGESCVSVQKRGRVNFGHGKENA